MGDTAGPGAGRAGYRRLAWAVLPVAVALALTGCGSAGTVAGNGGVDGASGATDGVGRAAPPSGGHPADVLAKWQAFPVTATPRPLILTRGAVLDPASGFLTGDDKLSYGAGNFEFATTVPATPATSAGYTIVSAKAALDRLRATGSPQPVTTRPLSIVAVSLVQATFHTDRGPRLLPAWRFRLDHVSDPVQVLAVESQYLWRPTWGLTGIDPDASLSGNGLSLDVSFWGSPAGVPPCGAEYTADVVESSTAVVVTPREVGQNSQGSSTSQACAAVAAKRTVTVRLAAPLGARVLLTPEGAAIPVTSS